MRAILSHACAAALATLLWVGPASAQATSAATEGAIAVEESRAGAWLNSLAAQLELTSAQKSAFAAYADAIRAQAKLKAEHRSAGMFVDTAMLPPAPDALQQQVTQLQQRADALAQVQAAAAKLYPELTPQQRTVFDFLAMTPIGLGSEAL